MDSQYEESLKVIRQLQKELRAVKKQISEMNI
jgi:hypothetical protein